MTIRSAVAPLAILLSLAMPAAAQQAGSNSAPEALALPPELPAPRDVAYPGTIALNIDATDTRRGIYAVTQTIPVAAGTRDLTLLEPLWIPGGHSPRNSLALFAQIRFEADGKPIAWQRDDVQVNAFHLALPEGIKTVTARFVHTSPLQTAEGRITMTQEMLNLQWEKMSLYPAGYYARQIQVVPTVKVPAGWSVFTALDGMTRQGDTVRWSKVDYATLVDSPIFAGLHAKSWDLGQNVKLDAVADDARDLAIKPEHLETYRKLVTEATALFGARHFDHYDLMLALTDRMGGIGLEHHRSSENQMEPNTWVDWKEMDWDRNVMPHELVHSWNGKYRRPADLWTPEYQYPMRGNLLWVYEGQTQFWGLVLAARSGVQSKDVVLGALAAQAGRYSEGLPGRSWRSVEDTTYDPIINGRKALPHDSLTRGEDYYNEGALVWLETDQVIRQGTRGAKGMDDFARAFFGMRDGDWGELTYTFDDVVSTLNSVYAHDWASFLRDRLYKPNAPAPLAGIEKAGYKLVWKDKPNAYTEGASKDRKTLDLTYSLGLAINNEGEVTSAVWDGPAFNAGVVKGAKIVAVNGTAYTPEVIKDAVTAGKGSNKAIELLVKRGEQFQTVPVTWNGGLRYPWLERVGGKETGLDKLLAPKG
ncbi:M61 family metallopeptidase [Novosphingobium sp. 9U]|uniref:M61 family metallopeptidase n=1 Tax=Novosphingobium sp. 9U TaxID=2653158 RepID=UPI0012F27E8C|nr:M61 family metallopeptidase [Novosphingobium sp. 9U]VWX53446.1 Peptidase M61 [Novosphingobium sp. 9U]